MAKREEFNREDNFDFDPNEILDEDPGSEEVGFDFLTDLPQKDAQAPGPDDLDDILSADFLSMLGIEPAEEIVEAPIAAPQEETPAEEPAELEPEEETFQDEDADMKEYSAASVPAFELEPELDVEFIRSVEEIFPAEESPEEVEAPVAEEPREKKEAPVRRRKKMSRERMIKEVFLPPAIAVLTLILVVTFIGSAISRTVKGKQDAQAALDASKQEASSALAMEAEDLVARATALASGYNYDAAISLLDTFSGDTSQYQVLLDAYNAINQVRGKLKPIDDPNSIPNLSFHCLIADPARAFTDKDYGKSYNQNYVTIDEFSRILNQLYANGYVLVDYNSFIVQTVGEDGKITYSTQPIYLPEGKKPVMLTETLVNYELFTVDSDGDLEADKGGDGFASKLVMMDGKIVNEYVDANGNVLYGAYDLVPILEEFIAAHPDFCYQGARAVLAVSGEDGIFGYRTMHSVKEKKGEDYYNEQVAGAQAVAQALRDRGYTIACYTYANVDYGAISATKIDVDLDNWKKEVVPILGDVPVMVFAKSSDGNYQDAKYNVLKNSGFRFFIGSANAPYAEVTVNNVRQGRIMVTGKNMTTNPDLFAKYFTAKEVLNDQRGK